MSAKKEKGITRRGFLGGAAVGGAAGLMMVGGKALLPATAEAAAGKAGKRLEVGSINIKKVQSGAKTEIRDGVLYVNVAELTTLLEQDSRLGRVDIDFANPGESTRVVRVLNIYEPRARTGERKGQFPFPGALGPGTNAGNGGIVALKGAAVAICNPSELWPMTQLWGARPRAPKGPDDPAGDSSVHVFQMNGPTDGVYNAATMACVTLCPYPTKKYAFKRLDIKEHPIPDRETWAATVELAGMRAAAYLGAAGESVKPDKVDVYELPPVWAIPKGMENLPKIAYISSLAHGNGPLPKDNFTNQTPPVLYGGSASGLLAMMVHPNDYIDGAVLRPHDHHYDTAYGMQNDEYLMELYRRHGKDLCFVGVVLTQHLLDAGAVNTANQLAVNMVVDILGADGAVVHKPGGGAPHGNTAQICKMLEKAGVKAVFLRSSQIPMYTNPDPQFGIISLGESPVRPLPAVEKVIGFDKSTLPNPPKGELRAMLFHPLLNRGGEKFVGIPKSFPIDDPYKGIPPMTIATSDKTGAQRAVEMVLNKIGGKSWKPEVIVDGAFPTVKVAPGVKDIRKARIAFVTGGGLVKIGEEPFTHSGAVDGRWTKYSLAGIDKLNPDEWEVHHSGYTPDWIKEDPHRLHPLPEIRQLEREAKFGWVSPILYSWSTLVGTMVGCRKVAEGILPHLKADRIEAVVMDAT